MFLMLYNHCFMCGRDVDRGSRRYAFPGVLPKPEDGVAFSLWNNLWSVVRRHLAHLS
jgi:hypothetical protein|eukprot:COSAG06_NODE_5293_length_3580_cov_227.388394_3_plen_57_part_00